MEQGELMIVVRDAARELKDDSATEITAHDVKQRTATIASFTHSQINKVISATKFSLGFRSIAVATDGVVLWSLT